MENNQQEQKLKEVDIVYLSIWRSFYREIYWILNILISLFIPSLVMGIYQAISNIYFPYFYSPFVVKLVYIASLFFGLKFANSKMEDFLRAFTFTVGSDERAVIFRDDNQYCAYIQVKGKSAFKKFWNAILWDYTRDKKYAEILESLPEGRYSTLSSRVGNKYVSNFPFLSTESRRHFAVDQPRLIAESRPNITSKNKAEIQNSNNDNTYLEWAEFPVMGKKGDSNSVVDFQAAYIRVSFNLVLKSLNLQQAAHLRNALQLLKPILYTRSEEEVKITYIPANFLAERKAIITFFRPKVEEILRQIITEDPHFKTQSDLVEAMRIKSDWAIEKGNKTLRDVFVERMNKMLLELTGTDFIQFEGIGFFADILPEEQAQEIKQQEEAAKTKVIEAENLNKIKVAEGNATAKEKESVALIGVSANQAVAIKKIREADVAGKEKYIGTLYEKFKDLDAESKKAFSEILKFESLSGSGNADVKIGLGDQQLNAASIIANAIKGSKPDTIEAEPEDQADKKKGSDGKKRQKP